MLSRALADEGHFPSIDVLRSISRLMNDIAPRTQLAHAQRVRAWLAAYRDAEDLINIGAYTAGANTRIDEAVAQRDRINVFLRQGLDERSPAAESVAQLAALATGG